MENMFGEQAIRVVPYLQPWHVGLIIAALVLLIVAINFLNKIYNILVKIYRIEKVKILEQGYLKEETNEFLNWDFDDQNRAIRKAQPEQPKQ